ncbi:MAG TPA: hypothetical protein DHV59_07785 [Oxalobacteraceae bacterium]|nr:hypothetical protein [Oxalobacteraceae bacterium]
MNNDTFAHRRAFYLLKKYSSYTWCAEIFRLTKQFAEELEQILRNPPPMFSPVLDLDEMYINDCWHACSKMEEGLALILKTDRTTGYTKFAEGSGFPGSGMYGEADRGAPCRYISNSHTDAKYRALGYSGDYRTVSSGLFSLLEQAMVLETYENPTIHIGPDSIWSHPESLNNRFWPRPITDNLRESIYPVFRGHPSQLPAVPKSDNGAPTIISGEEVLITGIWQPEILKPLDKKTLALIGGIQSYCMNFLVQGYSAPNMVPESAYELWAKTGDGPTYLKSTHGAVRWRLLWADDRYGKNNIPEEEKDYLRSAPPATVASLKIEKSRIAGGQSCSKTGYWFTPAQANSRRHFKEGEIMPEIGSDYGTTIWQWDSNQG